MALPREVRWVLKWQGLTALCTAMAAGLLGGAHAAVSALLGGGIGMLGVLAYAWRAWRGGGKDPGKLYRAQMLGEIYKFAIVLGSFALVFLAYQEVAALPLFLSFALTAIVYWMALLKIWD